MTRVKRGTTSLKRRRKILKLAKGYRHGGSTKERQARETLLHAGRNAFNDRRKKKGDFRKLWQIKINAAARSHGFSYSQFMGTLLKKGIAIDRKILADLAEHEPDIFEKIVANTKS